MNKFSQLPSGIYYLPTRGGMTYLVRFMIDGARISLGSHASIEDAINTMIDFKIADLEKQRTQMLQACGAAEVVNNNALVGIKEALSAVAVELSSAESTMLASYQELLESVPPHELSFHGDAKIGDVTVPARIVKAFLDNKFGE